MKGMIGFNRMSKFQIGDRVKLIKPLIDYAMEKGKEGFVACLPDEGKNKRQIRVGVDWGIEDNPYYGKLSYYDSEGEFHSTLRSPTGMFVYQSYLDHAGPPDEGEDWI